MKIRIINTVAIAQTAPKLAYKFKLLLRKRGAGRFSMETRS